MTLQLSFKKDNSWINLRLYEKVSKKGVTYYRAYHKESDKGYSVFINKNNAVILLDNNEKIELKKFSNDDGSVVYTGGGFRISGSDVPAQKGGFKPRNEELERLRKANRNFVDSNRKLEGGNHYAKNTAVRSSASSSQGTKKSTPPVSTNAEE